MRRVGLVVLALGGSVQVGQVQGREGRQVEELVRLEPLVKEGGGFSKQNNNKKKRIDLLLGLVVQVLVLPVVVAETE